MAFIKAGNPTGRRSRVGVARRCNDESLSSPLDRAVETSSPWWKCGSGTRGKSWSSCPEGLRNAGVRDDRVMARAPPFSGSRVEQ